MTHIRISSRASHLPETKHPSREFFALPRWVWATTVAFVLLGSIAPNPLLTPASIIILIGCIQLLWRPGEPPVLAFACMIQWLQSSATIFYTDFHGLSVQEASGRPEFEQAIWLSLLGVLSLALGMRTALIGSSWKSSGLLAEGMRIQPRKAFLAYVVSLIIAFVTGRLIAMLPALAQPLGALLVLKWVMVFVLTYTVLEQRTGYQYIFAIVIFEVTVGLLGFFAEFKSVFFVLIIATMASPLALRGRRLATTLAAAFALFLFGVVWSAIKAEYRDFISGGSREQVVVVSAEDRVSELGGLVSNLTWGNFADGFDNLMLRVGYTNLFALTLANVPQELPYEDGKLWLEALQHILTPRLLFPGKAAISDSDRASLYTGVEFAGAEQGTSIGIGYMAESYVDFGQIGMFVPIFALGFFFGLIYRLFLGNSYSKIIAGGVVTAIIVFNAYAIETSNIKIVGGTVTTLLGFIILVFSSEASVREWLFQDSRRRMSLNGPDVTFQ